MTPAQAQSLLAAGLDDPWLIERWRREPELLGPLGVDDPGVVDLDTLARFAGMAAMVKHNQLRSFLPLTFRLMRSYGVDLELFTAYAMTRSRTRMAFAPSAAGKAVDLVEFASGWLGPDDAAHVAVLDAARYELAVARLGPWFDAGLPAGTDPVRDGAGVRGHIILLELRSEPATLADALESGIDTSSIALSPRSTCLWRDPVGHVSIVSLDPLHFEVLASIADDRPLQQLVDALDVAGAAVVVAEAARRLAEAGVVSTIGIERVEREALLCT